MLLFKLDKQIDCNWLCGAIQKEIVKASQNGSNGNSILCIEIKNTIDSQDNSLIPKLTYVDNSLTN